LRAERKANGDLARLLIDQEGNRSIDSPAAIAAGKLASSLLFGVTPTTPHTFALVAGLFASVAVVATVWPARRAARIDPVVALRAD
jgi:hypothetical protein